MDEDVPAMGGVVQGDRLAQRAVNHGVDAGYVACADRVHANFTLLAQSLLAASAVDEAVGIGAIRGFADVLSEGHGAATGGVLLESVVLLDDLDVVVFAQHGGRLADQSEQDVHADAHVRAVDDGDLACGDLEGFLLGGRKSCRSND